MREMKDSGIEWVGLIPNYWEINKAKYFMTLLERPTKDDDGVITCFRNGEVTLRSNRREDGFTIATVEAGYQGIEPGDLVVHGMDGFAGAIGISDSRGKGSPALNILDCSENKKYIMYLLRTMAYQNVFLAIATGIRVRTCDTSWKKLRNLDYIIPPLSEQSIISAYLDRKCAEIDTLTADIETQIETLEQYKRSVITEAVTKGLNPDVEMKNSGAGWLGTVPTTWKTDKLKYHLQRNEPRNPGDKVVLSLYRELGIIPKDSRDDNHNVTSEDTSNYKYVRPGDFIINKMKAWQGSVAVSDYEGIVSPAYFVYNFTDNAFYKRYFHYLLRGCYKDEFMCLSGGIRVGQWDLPSSGLDNTIVLIPPIDEQHAIADYLDRKCAEIDTLTADKRTQLDTLAEYKKSLIYEYVTGKKEVPVL
ncbi:MAG: restriction endonuclease subunit S [Lachnospiraceae bacterium]|nr:restriction endonuclease subunit S [Lachnospiraceae bacterium]